MFLKLNHQKLEIYSISRVIVLESFKLTGRLPIEEKCGMITQISRAALSVHLNITEGFSRKSKAERKRYYEIARGSIIEIDAAPDVANDPGYLKNTDLAKPGESMIHCFKMLTGLINSQIKSKD